MTKQKKKFNVRYVTKATSTLLNSEVNYKALRRQIIIDVEFQRDLALSEIRRLKGAFIQENFYFRRGRP